MTLATTAKLLKSSPDLSGQLYYRHMAVSDSNLISSHLYRKVIQAWLGTFSNNGFLAAQQFLDFPMSSALGIHQSY